MGSIKQVDGEPPPQKKTKVMSTNENILLLKLKTKKQKTQKTLLFKLKKKQKTLKQITYHFY